MCGSSILVLLMTTFDRRDFFFFCTFSSPFLFFSLSNVCVCFFYRLVLKSLVIKRPSSTWNSNRARLAMCAYCIPSDGSCCNAYLGHRNVYVPSQVCASYLLFHLDSYVHVCMYGYILVWLLSALELCVKCVQVRLILIFIIVGERVCMDDVVAIFFYTVCIYVNIIIFCIYIRVLW